MLFLEMDTAPRRLVMGGSWVSQEIVIREDSSDQFWGGHKMVVFNFGCRAHYDTRAMTTQQYLRQKVRFPQLGGWELGALFKNLFSGSMIFRHPLLDPGCTQFSRLSPSSAA